MNSRTENKFFPVSIVEGNVQFAQNVTFDGFQTKPLWELKMLQKLLLLEATLGFTQK